MSDNELLKLIQKYAEFYEEKIKNKFLSLLKEIFEGDKSKLIDFLSLDAEETSDDFERAILEVFLTGIN